MCIRDRSMGYKLYGTSGTCAWLNKHMVPCNEVRNMSGESPNIVDLLQSLSLIHICIRHRGLRRGVRRAGRLCQDRRHLRQGSCLLYTSVARPMPAASSSVLSSAARGPEMCIRDSHAHHLTGSRGLDAVGHAAHLDVGAGDCLLYTSPVMC